MDKKQRFVDVIFINDNDEVLLLKRRSDAEFMPNKWCLPGGHLDEGYKLIECGIKELEEETGIKCETLGKLINWTYKDGSSTTIFVGLPDFISEDDPFHKSGKINITIMEHSDYKFVKFKDIKKYDLMPELNDIINEVLKN